MLFLGRHLEAGRPRDLHKGVKPHQVPQDQVHIHRVGRVAGVQAAGVGPGAGGGADLLGQAVHLAHPAGQVVARQLVGHAHGGVVGVAQQHGIQRFPQGEGLARAHIGVVGAVNVVRDGKGHLKGAAVQLVAVVGQDQRGAHQLGQAAGGHLGGAVLFVEDDVGVGVDDIGALGLYLVERAGVKDGPGRRGQAAHHQSQGQKQCKKSFHVDNSLGTRYNSSVDFDQKHVGCKSVKQDRASGSGLTLII